MKKIGIYLASRPESGGTYQYCLSIIAALKVLIDDDYSVTAFFHSKDWEAVLPKKFIKKHRKRNIFHRLFGRFYRFIDRSEKNILRFSNLFNPMIRIINHSDCDVVIFPSQDSVSYQIKKKSISTIHDLMHRYEPYLSEYQDGEYHRREKHFKAISKYTNLILVDSNVGKMHVIDSYSVEENKIFVLPFVAPLYMLQTAYEDVKKKYNLPSKYFFYPAQFWEHKNHISLLDALKILNQKGIKVNLVLVGAKKNNYEKVLKKIKELNLLDQVKILGYVSNNEMASLYNSAFATVFVSILGPTNIPPIEALVSDCPLICSNSYAMPEQIGDAALYVNARDPKDIANKIIMLLENKELSRELKENGRKVISNYGPVEFQIKLKKAIDSIVDDVTQT